MGLAAIRETFEETGLMLGLRSTGLPAKVKVFAAKIGRTTMAREDVEPVYTYKDGFFTAPLTLGKGAWLAHVEAVAEDGTKFKQRLNFFVN